MKFVLPAPHQAFDLSMRDGAVIRVRQHGNPAGPRIALCHGNGLASDAYYPFWRLLEAQYELILFDVRNHGRNPPHGAGGHNWANFANDQREIHAGIASVLGAKPAVAAFHSLSAIAALSLAVDGEAPWSALLLFDPPIPPPRDHRLYQALPPGHQRRRAPAGQPCVRPAGKLHPGLRRVSCLVPGGGGPYGVGDATQETRAQPWTRWGLWSIP